MDRKTEVWLSSYWALIEAIYSELNLESANCMEKRGHDVSKKAFEKWMGHAWDKVKCGRFFTQGQINPMRLVIWSNFKLLQDYEILSLS